MRSPAKIKEAEKILAFAVADLVLRASGSSRRLPASGSRTTVRTVRYTAVHEKCASLRCSSMKLIKTNFRSAEVGTA